MLSILTTSFGSVDSGNGFCNKTKQIYHDNQCCPQNANGVVESSIQRDAELMRLASTYSSCLFKGFEMKNLSTISNLNSTQDIYTAFAFGDVIPFLKNEPIPETWIQCPGALYTYAYMFNYVTVEGLPQTGTCNDANVELIRVLDEVYTAERRVGFDVRTEGGLALWTAAFSGVLDNKIQPIWGIDQDWVDSVFSRIQGVDANLDVVRLCMATAITHIGLIGPQMSKTFTATFETPYVNVEKTLALDDPEVNDIKGELLDNKGLFDDIAIAIGAKCEACPRTRSHDGIAARRFFGLSS